jgi:hypothetical protein
MERIHETEPNLRIGGDLNFAWLGSTDKNARDYAEEVFKTTMTGIFDLSDKGLDDAQLAAWMRTYGRRMADKEWKILDLSGNMVTDGSLPLISRDFLDVDPKERVVFVKGTDISFSNMDMSFIQACNMVTNGERKTPVFVTSKEDMAPIVMRNAHAITQNARDVAQIRAAVEENTRDIAQNTRDVAQIRAAVEENTRDIAQNTRDVAQIRAAVGRIEQLLGEISRRLEGLEARRG